MKIQSINNAMLQPKNNNTRNTNFTGLSDTLVKFWQFVDNGGRAIQFTVEDMFGTNLPRTYKGAMSGYKYTGKINVPSLLQEGIREFLTGPVMCATPIAVLGAFSSLSGKTSNTHFENIRNLSYLASTLTDESQIAVADFEDNYIRKVVKDMLKQSSGEQEPLSEDVDELAQGIKNYFKSTETISTLKGKEKKEAKKMASKSLSKLETTFETIIKRTKDSYLDTDFKIAKYSLNDSKTGGTNFKNYINYMSAFITDYVKTNKTADNMVDLQKDTIKAFKENWLGNRAIVASSMFALTAIAISVIPKIYTYFSGKVNPNAAEIYNEAKKEDRK